MYISLCHAPILSTHVCSVRVPGVLEVLQILNSHFFSYAEWTSAIFLLALPTDSKAFLWCQQAGIEATAGAYTKVYKGVNKSCRKWPPVPRRPRQLGDEGAEIEI